jgi:hypothetical protein
MRPFDGYPTSWGSSRASVFPHAGPSSYTRVTVTAGTVPATAGDTVQAIEAGLKYFDFVAYGVTDDGAFAVIPIPAAKSNATPNGTPTKTYILQWMALVTATVGGQVQTAGSEAAASTNLSAEIVRLLAVGPK